MNKKYKTLIEKVISADKGCNFKNKKHNLHQLYQIQIMFL